MSGKLKNEDNNWLHLQSDDNFSSNVDNKNVKETVNNIPAFIESQSKVLAEMRDNPNVKISDIIKNTHLAKSTVDKAISKLKKKDIL